MALDISRIKALCFDVDGTLSDTDDLYVHKVSRFFPKLLFKDPNHAARRFVMWVEAPGNALLGFTDTIGLDDEIVAFIDWFSRHQKRQSKKFWLIPGVDEMLKQLKGHYAMAVVSARDEKGTLRFLEQFDLGGEIQVAESCPLLSHQDLYSCVILLHHNTSATGQLFP